MNDQPLEPIVHTCSHCKTSTECVVSTRVHAWEKKLNEIHDVICGDPFSKDPDGMVHVLRRHDEELKKLKKVASDYTMDKAKLTGAAIVLGGLAGLAGDWIKGMFHSK